MSIEDRKEEIIDIFENTEAVYSNTGDKALLGLIILSKYSCSKTVIEGADHEIIYSIDLDTAIEGGITDEDCIQLAKLNFMIENGEYFSRFV